MTADYSKKISMPDVTVGYTFRGSNELYNAFRYSDPRVTISNLGYTGSYGREYLTPSDLNVEDGSVIESAQKAPPVTTHVIGRLGGNEFTAGSYLSGYGDSPLISRLVTGANVIKNVALRTESKYRWAVSDERFEIRFSQEFANYFTYNSGEYVLNSAGERLPRSIEHTWMLYIKEGAIFHHEEGDSEGNINVAYTVYWHFQKSNGLHYRAEYIKLKYKAPEDINEAPTDIILTNINGAIVMDGTIVGEYTVDSTESILLGTLTGVDPDAADDHKFANNIDPDNNFSMHEFFLDEASAAFFKIAANANGDIELHLKSLTEGDFSSVNNGGTISATVIIKDNTGAAENERKSYTKTFTFTIGDINEAPTDIILTHENEEVTSNTYRADSTEDKIIGTLTGTDPDRLERSAPTNNFGKFDFAIDDTTSKVAATNNGNEGFSLRPLSAGSATLYFKKVAKDDYTYVNKLSATIIMRDNLGEADSQRLSRKEAYFIDIDHTLSLSAPEAVTIDEDTPYVFSQNGDIPPIFVSGADGKQLTLTLTVLHGILATAQTIGSHNDKSVAFTNGGITGHRLELTNINEHDLSALLEGLVYTPDENYHGTDELKVELKTIKSEAGQPIEYETDSATGQDKVEDVVVNIEITPVDDAPVIRGFDNRLIHRNLADTVFQKRYLADESPTSETDYFVHRIDAGAAVTLDSAADGLATVYDPDEDAKITGSALHIEVIYLDTHEAVVGDTTATLNRNNKDRHIVLPDLGNDETGVYESDFGIYYQYDATPDVADDALARVKVATVIVPKPDDLADSRLVYTFKFLGKPEGSTMEDSDWEDILKPALNSLLQSIQYVGGGFTIPSTTPIEIDDVPLSDKVVITAQYENNIPEAADADAESSDESTESEAENTDTESVKSAKSATLIVDDRGADSDNSGDEHDLEFSRYSDPESPRERLRRGENTDFEDGDVTPNTESDLTITERGSTNVERAEAISATLTDDNAKFEQSETAAEETTNGPTIIRYHLPESSRVVRLWNGIFEERKHIDTPTDLDGAWVEGLNEAIKEYEKYANIKFELVSPPANNQYDISGIDIILFEGVYKDASYERKATVHKFTQESEGGAQQNDIVSIILPDLGRGDSLRPYDLKNKILTELGYAIGLRDPNPQPGDSASNYLPYGESKLHNTIYGLDYFTSIPSLAEKLQVYDIAALQHLYGENKGIATGEGIVLTEEQEKFNDKIFKGDTIHLFNHASSSDAVGGYYLLYDIDGTDTLIFTGDNRQLRHLDLEPGARSDIQNNNGFVIAYNTYIENVIGSNADDRISGNSLDNVLEGGAGADTLDGRSGFDTASYAHSTNKDGLTIDMHAQEAVEESQPIDLRNYYDDLYAGLTLAQITAYNNYLLDNNIGDSVEEEDEALLAFLGLSPPDPNAVVTIERTDSTGDVFINIEKIVGSSFGDTIIGNNDHNVLDGGTHNPDLLSIRGIESGNGGSDSLTGNGGSDIFIVELGRGKGHDTIEDFQRGIDELQIRVFDGLTLSTAISSGTVKLKYEAADTPGGHSLILYIAATVAGEEIKDGVTIKFLDTIADAVDFTTDEITVSYDDLTEALGSPDSPTPPDII